MNNEQQEGALTYAGSGVDIQAQAQLVDKIKQLSGQAPRQGVLAGVGGFGALFELPMDRYPQPVLVSGSDGVGTKLKLAHQLSRHDTIGIDLVAMCVNDVLCHRADPLFFLDYYATGKLQVDQAERIISGIAKGCCLAGCALIGGETAELPGMYHGEDYDLAGFCVGGVDKPNLIEPSCVQEGDQLIALASSGPHSNGYSLIRAIVEHAQAELSEPMADSTLGNALLEPTRIYAKCLQALWQRVSLHGIAHITGGGIVENLPRILPTHCAAQINVGSWEWPEVFHWLQSNGNVALAEMRKTFNLGVGMVLVVAPDERELALDILAESGEQAWLMGDITAAEDVAPAVIWRGE